MWVCAFACGVRVTCVLCAHYGRACVRVLCVVFVLYVLCVCMRVLLCVCVCVRCDVCCV